MGGPGSGNWDRSDRKTTVEECHSIDAVRLQREGILRAGHWVRGAWEWFNPTTGKCVASIDYEVDTRYAAQPRLTLTYRCLAANGIDTTQPPLGGLRWWFTCPLMVNGVPCGRRVRKLHRRARYFGCRICHDLTYRSCQTAHQSVRRMEGVGRFVEAIRKRIARISGKRSGKRSGRDAGQRA
jgi:hypothetical protein